MSIFGAIGSAVGGAVNSVGSAAGSVVNSVGGVLGDIFNPQTHSDPEPRGSTTYVDYSAKGEDFRGTASNDTHYGTQHNDTIYGQDGNDVDPPPWGGPG